MTSSPWAATWIPPSVIEDVGRGLTGTHQIIGERNQLLRGQLIVGTLGREDCLQIPNPQGVPAHLAKVEGSAANHHCSAERRTSCQMGHNRANQTPSPAVPVTLAILVSSFLTLILPERSPDTSSLAPDALAIRLLWNNLCVCVMTGRRAQVNFYF